jgi:hypothetical protein
VPQDRRNAGRQAGHHRASALSEISNHRIYCEPSAEVEFSFDANEPRSLNRRRREPIAHFHQYWRALSCCSSGLVTSETWIQAAFLIELADDLRELLSRSAGQNDGRTLIRKRRAVTAPMPEPAPVTMTNLPSNRWKPIRFSSAPSVPVYSPFSSRRSAIAEEIRSLEGRRREPGTHFQRYGGALG